MMETDYGKFIYALRVCCELVPNLIIYDCTHTQRPTPTQVFGSGDHMRGQTQIAWETRLTESHDGLGGPSLKTSWLWLFGKLTPTPP